MKRREVLNTGAIISFKCSQRGSALLQALVVTLMVGVLAGSVGSYLVNSSTANKRAMDLEGYSALGHELTAFVSDSNLCPESLRIADGQFGNLANGVAPTQEQLQFRGLLSPYLLAPASGGAPSNFNFNDRNNYPWFPNYGWAVGNPLNWYSRGPGRMYITEIALVNIQPKQGGTFGNTTEWQGDLVVQAFPMTADLQDIVQERALARKTISKLYIAYLFDDATNQGRIVRCNADADPSVYCTELGGTYQPDAAADEPKCLFGFTDASPCGANEYIKDFGTDGTPICQPLNIVPCGPGYYATGIYKNERMVCKELAPCASGYYRHGNYCVPMITPTPTPTPTSAPTPTSPATGCWVDVGGYVDLTTINDAGYPSAQSSCGVGSVELSTGGSCNLGETCDWYFKYGERNYECQTCAAANSCQWRANYTAPILAPSDIGNFVEAGNCSTAPTTDIDPASGGTGAYCSTARENQNYFCGPGMGGDPVQKGDITCLCSSSPTPTPTVAPTGCREIFCKPAGGGCESVGFGEPDAYGSYAGHCGGSVYCFTTPAPPGSCGGGSGSYCDRVGEACSTQINPSGGVYLVDACGCDFQANRASLYPPGTWNDPTLYRMKSGDHSTPGQYNYTYECYGGKVVAVEMSCWLFAGSCQCR